MEHCTIRIDRDDPAPGEFRGYFSRVFRSQDGHPRPVLLKVCTRNDRNKPVAIDVKDGNPTFFIKGREPAPADFRGRWLPEHEVPLILNPPGKCWFVVTPADGNRLRIRRAKWWERWFK